MDEIYIPKKNRKVTKSAWFVAVEGIDGCGKSTLISRALMSNLGSRVKSVCQPTYGQYGRKIREAAARGERLEPEEEYKLLMLDRHDLMIDVGLYLSEGINVISDRHYFSTAAYQSFKSDLKMEDIVSQNIRCFGVPNLTIILDIDPCEAEARLSVRGDEDAFDANLALQMHCADVYEHIKGDGVLHIDASRDEDAVYADFKDALLSL